MGSRTAMGRLGREVQADLLKHPPRQIHGLPTDAGCRQQLLLREVGYLAHGPEARLVQPRAGVPTPVGPTLTPGKPSMDVRREPIPPISLGPRRISGGMAKKKLYSVQRMRHNGEWHTLTSFAKIPRGEAMGALRMADAHYGTPRYRVVEDDPQGGVGDVVKEGGGRGFPKPT